MKCPIDQTEMEKGVADRGMWIKGEASKFYSFMAGTNNSTRIIMIAYRCTKCGKIEFTTVVEK